MGTSGLGSTNGCRRASTKVNHIYLGVITDLIVVIGVSHHVLSEPGFSSSSNGNCGLSSDEEDYDDGELIFGGSDDGV